MLSVQTVDALNMTKIYVNPATVTKGVGESFSVEVKITDADDLFTFGFYVKWRGASMDITKIEEGDFLSHGGVYWTFLV